jgi:tetratricopeptide (TPR) repeat protein
MTERVRAWSEPVVIPTYGIGAPLKQPQFLNQRVYQGSSGVVYPFPVIDSVSDEKFDKTYTGVFLENAYLKIMILPELGGRVQMALDKTNGYHFVYYNRVIKPALVGLSGPWISGGIEFNWPQHHRPSTFEPVDWRIVEHADGSATIWCSEIERMFFTKGLHGFTLHPDKAVLNISAQLHNRTAEAQTFLWWANPAVHVNDDYQSVFPPDVHAVMDHGKRDVSEFPIAKGTYYKVDYAPGTDISRYKNIPVPTSYMAYHSDYDFVGNYDHGKQAGMMHVANHHLVPGKKQWTWGNSDFGLMWDRQLTDEDGPYIELMCGAFTDNQPDFSWLMPGEEKRFEQNFMPYKGIGPASNANTDVVVHLTHHATHCHVGVYVTSPRRVTVTLHRNGALLWQRETTLDPVTVLVEDVAVHEEFPAHELVLTVNDGSGRQLLRYAPPKPAIQDIPAAATPAKPPAEIGSTDELFLNGLHLEQYRHATFKPTDYYLEALRRDPYDARCNNAMGVLALRRGDFQAAEHSFRRAIVRLISRNPNPYDGEAYYNLGLALRFQQRYDEAFDAFYKATWNAAWQDAAFFELARIQSRRGNLHDALALTQSALRRNASHHQARHLEIALLRRIGRTTEAHDAIATAFRHDPMDPGAAWEERTLAGTSVVAQALVWNAHLCESIALEYIHAGDSAQALAVLATGPADAPLNCYLKALVLHQAGQATEATATLQQAATCPPDWCFPHRLEHVVVLQHALAQAPTDGRASYYLGNFWYAHHMPDAAIECWQHAVVHEPTNAVAWRNLGLAYTDHHADLAAASNAYAEALRHDPADARLRYEADQLARVRGDQPHQRLRTLTGARALVDQRDDLTIEYVTLLNNAGRYAEAVDMLRARSFHPWEGGEGRVAAQYVAGLIGMAQTALTHDAARALDLLEQAINYPHNLGEGKLPGSNENHIHYWRGVALAQLGQHDAARIAWQRATRGDSEPTSARYYNDQPPDMIWYQGIAWRKLGDSARATALFERLIAYARAHRDDVIRPDYFAVSYPTFLVFNDDSALRHGLHCDYMEALGQLGLQQFSHAKTLFDTVLQREPNHSGALTHQRFLDRTDI